MNKDASVIPEGLYCYKRVKYLGKGRHKVKNCNYFTTRNINGVVVVWCDFLDQGSCGNCTDEEYDKLLEYYGSEEKLDEELEFLLLWDGCKICGVNEGDLEE